MKTWQAGLLGVAALAAVVTGAFFWTGAATSQGTDDPYWACMSEYGYAPNTPADSVDPTSFSEANAACD